mmetsp:Transcript_82874/g.121386  ORF Transcript_82874/g.121386 Transcript_82874/m.121386 type:complete len:86 (-) Transcript_82874:128-385(-)
MVAKRCALACQESQVKERRRQLHFQALVEPSGKGRGERGEMTTALHKNHKDCHAQGGILHRASSTVRRVPMQANNKEGGEQGRAG